MKLYRGAELDELTFEAGFLPMLVPPVPWVSTTHGGYLLNAGDCLCFSSVGLYGADAS